MQGAHGTSATGSARTVPCGQGDNLMVHAVLTQVRAGDILVLAMPAPEPVALVGGMLAIQAACRRASALLVDAAVRDTEELAKPGLPIWTRYVRVHGAIRSKVGAIDQQVEIDSSRVCAGDVGVLDSDDAVVVLQHKVCEVLEHAGTQREAELRVKLEAGALTYELHDLKKLVEEGAHD